MNQLLTNEGFLYNNQLKELKKEFCNKDLLNHGELKDILSWSLTEIFFILGSLIFYFLDPWWLGTLVVCFPIFGVTNQAYKDEGSTYILPLPLTLIYKSIVIKKKYKKLNKITLLIKKSIDEPIYLYEKIIKSTDLQIYKINNTIDKIRSKKCNTSLDEVSDLYLEELENYKSTFTLQKEEAKLAIEPVMEMKQQMESFIIANDLVDEIKDVRKSSDALIKINNKLIDKIWNTSKKSYSNLELIWNSL